MFPSTLLPLLLSLAPLSIAASTANIYEDLFAHPQYEISFSPSPLTPAEARTLIASPPPHTTYETLLLHSHPFLCSVPSPPPPPAPQNATERLSLRRAEAAEEERAAKNGLELVRKGMDKKCLYYTADWWSYSLCYPRELRQFHAKAVKNGGIPKEDPEGLTYVLGRGGKGKAGEAGEVTVKTNGETKFLVEKWGGGTICDLTGRPRTVEVHWFCGNNGGEGGGERIGGVREIATCVYAVTVFSEGLCRERAFLPAERGRGERVVCREVMGEGREELYREFRKRLEKAKLGEEEVYKMVGQGTEVDYEEVLVKDEL